MSRLGQDAAAAMLGSTASVRDGEDRLAPHVPLAAERERRGQLLERQDVALLREPAAVSLKRQVGAGDAEQVGRVRGRGQWPPGQDPAAARRSLNQATVAAIASGMGVGAIPSRVWALAPSTTKGCVNS